MHKSGGSLTQSSLLLCGPAVNEHYVRQVINLTQTTSGSYLLMSSLDISRRNLALQGVQIFEKVKNFAAYARSEINAIGDYYAYGSELVNGDSIYDFDMIGAMLVMNGTWNRPGVYNIEEFDPDPFMDALNQWGLPWVESFAPTLVD